MSIPELMHVSEGPQRFDVFTGAGRRRRFTAGGKAAIVEESYADGNSVCGVARRHSLTSQQLFGWRRLARLGPSRCVERPLFVPVIVASEPEQPPTPSKPRRRRRNEGASIELEIDGVVVRVDRDADAGAIAAVFGALTLAFMSSQRGSIAINHEGGLELYRASKAALNMLARGIYGRNKA